MNDESLFDLARLKELGGFKAGDLLAVDPKLYPKLMTHLSKEVKRDKVTKSMVCLTGLSAFTSEPINLFLRGPSTIGKTHNVVKTLAYFPREHIWLLGGLSATAIVHERATLVDDNGEEIKPENKPVKPKKRDYADAEAYQEAWTDYEENQKRWIKRLQNSRHIVDLTGKILVFLDAPHIETFNRLRPILSHDTKEISYKFTDKNLTTQHVVIRGWPATIFCSTAESYVQDLATRSFTHTPETEPVKYADANKLSGTKSALPWEFERDMDTELLEAYIRFLSKNLKDFKIVVPYGPEFGAKFPHRFARSMRDFKHILSLVKVSALFHFAQRPILHTGEKEEYVMATQQDYDFVMALWRRVKETTETSAPGHVIKFFHQVVEKLAKEQRTFLIKDLVEKWNSLFEDKRSSRTIRSWVEFLCEVEYMTKEVNPDNKRSKLLRIIKEHKSGESGSLPFSHVFTLESFKAWLTRVKKHCGNNKVYIQEKISDKQISLEEVFKKYFSVKEVSFPHYFIEELTPSLDESGEEKRHSPKLPYSPLLNVTSEKSEKSPNGLSQKPIVEPIRSGAEPCPLCGKFPVAFLITYDGEKLRRCRQCTRDIQKRLNIHDVRELSEGEAASS
jgi:hypothetical protein